MNKEEFIQIINQEIEKGERICLEIDNLDEPLSRIRGSMYTSRVVKKISDSDYNKYSGFVTSWEKMVLSILKVYFGNNQELIKEFDLSNPEHWFNFKSSAAKAMRKNLTTLNSYMERLPYLEEANSSENKDLKHHMSNKVFVVHGHDTKLRTEVELFLKEHEFEPIVLFKEANSGRTIIEKFEDKAEEADFAIVLYTACDIGADKSNRDQIQPRARQNVVFEHGYLCGKLGRKQVCAILEKGVEMPGDLSGLVYINYNDQWKINVAKEMYAAGLMINMSLKSLN